MIAAALARANPLAMVAVLWRRFRARPKSLPIMGGYTAPGFLQRHRKKLLFALFLFVLIYSMAFHLFGRFLIVQFLAPLAVLGLLVIWALPEIGKAPTATLRWLFFAFIFALLCWPDYLALALPGMPWVTAIRLVGVPLALILLISLSISRNFRAEMHDIISAVPWMWKLLVTFIVIGFFSIFISSNIGTSANKFVIALLYWLCIFFAAVYVFSKPGSAMRFTYILWGIVIFLLVLGVLEWRTSQIPWAPYIPSFLKIEDESVQKILAGSARSATGIYRVQGKFTTPLGFAEFLALASPFIVFLILETRNQLVRLSCALTLPVILFVIIATDSRLGIVGFLMTFMLFVAAWAAQRWSKDKTSLFGPAIILAYPVIFAIFIISTFAIGRLRSMVWGGGAESYSTLARIAQLDMAMPKILSEPWGHGIGRGASTVGYVNLADVLTLDSYFITVAIEYGVIGFLAYYGMFLFGIVQSGKYFLFAKCTETRLLSAVAVALMNFVIIKSVFSQQENHPLVFALLGMAVALIWRVQKTMPVKQGPAASAPGVYVAPPPKLVEDW
jgi:hypothetical protein